jgi:hypothetical protein
VIRQAITCDICGSEKRQTNHWFVAYELNGELRMSGWTSRHRLRPGSKHLCGQTCLHKLVDDFMARSIAVRTQRAGEGEPLQLDATDTSLTSPAAYVEAESSIRLVPSVELGSQQPILRPQSELGFMPASAAAAIPPKPVEHHYNSAAWRSEAWERERERERELHAAKCEPDMLRRRLHK